MDNCAQVQEPYDVRLEFGTTPYSSQGDVNEATLTFYIDGGDSNLTAVVNTDNGGGMALTGGIGNTGDDLAAVYETNVVASDDFNGISYASQSDIVSYGGYWQATNGELEANGCHDGNLWFETAQVNGDAETSFDARAPHTEYFENGGCYGDNLEVWVLVDGNEWVLMDTFVVNDEGTALVGDTTGQTITADSQTLTYSGGALDGASSVQLVLDADITANNEEIFIDNVEVSTLTEVEVPVDEHGTCEDFEDAAAGDTAALQFDGFTVTAQRAGDAADSENDAMIFDTANPTGGDSDLGYADQGNAIIISEDNDATDPDDNAGGGTITFDFAAPSDVVSLNVLDIEEEGGAIDLYDSEGELIDSIAIPAAGDNSVQTIDIAVDGVASMQVTLAGSGAVDDLCYASETGGNCGQYDVTYDDLMKDADPAAVADDQTTADDEVDDMADAMA